MGSSAAAGSTTDQTAAAMQDLSVSDTPPADTPPAEATPPCYLPFEVMVAVLQHVSQQQRLQVAALVSRTWAAAAAAASSSIQLSLANIPAAARHERTANISQWLQQHAWQVRSLQLQGNYMSRPRLVLPADALQSLQQLTVTDCRVCFINSAANGPAAPSTAHSIASSSQAQQLHGGRLAHHTHARAQTPNKLSSQAQQQSVPGAAATLTTLRLQGCVLEWGRGLPAPSLSLGNLQCLDLQQLLPGELSREQQQTLQQLVPAAFKQLSQLTQLVLKSLNQYEAVLLAGLAAGLGSMRGLLQLQVDMMQLTAPALADLPPTVTLLELAGAKQLVLSRAALPCLAKLASLQELYIEGVRHFEPWLLSSMPQLRTFRLRSSSSRFLPDGITGTRDLLVALNGLTGLQCLGARNVLQHLLPEEQAQLYGGLSASSLLEQLDLSACRFPPNTGQVLLHTACSLPHLQRLVLYRCEDPPGSVLQIQDLDTLVECCPALQELALWLPARSSSAGSGGGAESAASSSSNAARGGRPSHGAPGSKQLQLAPLLALPDLTSLVVAGPGVTCAELAAVGQLHLSSLALYRCSALADPALLQLTQLNQLTVLAIDAHSCVTKWPGVSEYLYLQGPAGQQAQAAMGSADRTQGIARAIMAVRRHLPVWQQLRRLLLTGSLLDEPPAD